MKSFFERSLPKQKTTDQYGLIWPFKKKFNHAVYRTIPASALTAIFTYYGINSKKIHFLSRRAVPAVVEVSNARLVANFLRNGGAIRGFIRHLLLLPLDSENSQ